MDVQLSNSKGGQRQNQEIRPNEKQKFENIVFPFVRDYIIVFHEQELYKLNITASEDILSILLISQSDFAMWKAEF